MPSGLLSRLHQAVCPEGQPASRLVAHVLYHGGASGAMLWAHGWLLNQRQTYSQRKGTVLVSSTQAVFIRAVGGFAPGCLPNCAFNADANMGHRFAILMAHVGALQPSASGAG